MVLGQARVLNSIVLNSMNQQLHVVNSDMIAVSAVTGERSIFSLQRICNLYADEIHTSVSVARKNIWLSYNSHVTPAYSLCSTAILNITRACIMYLTYAFCNVFVLQIVRTLCLFLTSAERKCSRLCRSETSFKYESGLFVQGLLKVRSLFLFPWAELS